VLTSNQWRDPGCEDGAVGGERAGMPCALWLPEGWVSGCLSRLGPMLWKLSLAARRAASTASLMLALAGIGIRKPTEASAPMPKSCAQRRAARPHFPYKVSLAGRALEPKISRQHDADQARPRLGSQARVAGSGQ
jgi:hypothetical protein